jgi:Transglycosylase SLT domain
MFFGITRLYFSVARRRRAAVLRHPSSGLGVATAGVLPGGLLSWDAMATPGQLGRPGDLPVPPGQELRRWGALLALAGLALPGVSAGRLAAAERRREVAVVEASADGTSVPAPGMGDRGGLLSGDVWGLYLPPLTQEAPAMTAPWEAGMVEADGMPLPTAPPPGPVPVDGIPLPAVAAPASPSAGPADDLVPADREYLRPILVRYAQENGLPADLVMSLAWVESSWRRTAVSDVGAVGVMQLMPKTVEFVSKQLLGLRSNLDPRNATSNVRMGTRYLKYLLAQNHGNVRQALIAYNQGLTSLKANGSYSLAERYADRVLALRPQFRSL